MSCCIENGSSPSLGPFYCNIERGESYTIDSGKDVTRIVDKRPLYSDIELEKQIGTLIIEKFIITDFSKKTVVVTLPQGQIVYNVYNGYQENGHLSPNQTFIQRIVDGSGDFVCADGLVVVNTDNTPVRTLLVYFSDFLCK